MNRRAHSRKSGQNTVRQRWPNERSGLLLVLLLSLVFGPALSVRAGTYDDLKTFVEHQTASGEKFISDLQHAQTAEEVGAALRASAKQQRQNTDELLAVLKRHPELRNLPELGLDRKALELWVEANPDGERKRATVPTEALEICDAMKRAATELGSQQKNQEAIQILDQFRGDPVVTDASNYLRAAMEDCRRRLLKAFL